MKFSAALLGLVALFESPHSVKAFGVTKPMAKVAFHPQEVSSSFPRHADRLASSLLSSNVDDVLPDIAPSPATSELLSEDQILHTAERLAGMSRGEISHIFNDIDSDGSGTIDLAEFDLLKKYFSETSEWTLEKKKQLYEEIDTNTNGTIDADEFYKWMVLNAKSEGTRSEDGSVALKTRQERLEFEKDSVPQKLVDLLEEIGVGAVVQKVTHPLHSAFGRTLKDHFVSCYVLARQWGNSPAVQEAAIFHALYQRGDGMRAVDFDEFRPILQEKLGKDVEELIYLFPSAHKSALLEDGILCAPVGGDLEIPNVLEGGTVTIPEKLRPALVELEVINSHDQHVLENSDPVHNLWTFFQHAPALEIMSDGAKETVIEFKKRALGASCKDIVAWHEGRFASAGQEPPQVWKDHIELFKEGGKFYCAEQMLKELGDKNGDGEIDWDEFISFDWNTCFID